MMKVTLESLVNDAVNEAIENIFLSNPDLLRTPKPAPKQPKHVVSFQCDHETWLKLGGGDPSVNLSRVVRAAVEAGLASVR